MNAGQQKYGPQMLIGNGLASDPQKTLSKFEKVLKIKKQNSAEFDSTVLHIIVPDDETQSPMPCILGILKWMLAPKA